MLTIIVVMLVAVEHIAIMLVEMFATPEQQAQAFDMSPEYTRQPAARVALANQGIYNGALGVMIIASYWLVRGINLITVWQMLLVFIIAVAFYGGLTATRKIWLVQLLPAAVAFLLTL